MTRPDDARLTFNEIPDIYDEVRTTYPPQMFDDLFDLLPADPHIVEVGPGTGQATGDLLARGASVHAIEIGPAMAAKLLSKLSSDRLRITIGDFEAAEVEPGADAVFSASAYHWISPSAQTDRPAEILTLGGVIAIVDPVQVEFPHDHGFFAAARPIYELYGQGHRGPPAPPRDSVEAKAKEIFERDRRFASTAVRRYDWNQTYSAAQYRKLMLSYSVTQMMDEPLRAGLLDDMESLIREEFGGYVTRPLVVTLTTAALVAR